jgi:DNA repair protein RecO (recombination protein O)
MSSSHTASGFIIGRLPFGNTGLILRWITADFGRVSTLAKGALKPKNPFDLHFDLYYRCEFQFVPARRGDLHLLKEVRLIEPNLGLRREWTTLLALEYFSALIEAMTESDAALPDDFDLFAKAVDYLNTHPATQRLVGRFEQKMLSIHGLAAAGNEDFVRAICRHHLYVPAQRERVFAELAL